MSLSVLGARVRGRQAGRLGGRSDAAVGRRRACSEEVLLCRRESAIMKENRTVGCLQTRTDTDRQARAGRGGVLERVMGEESVREAARTRDRLAGRARRALTLDGRAGCGLRALGATLVSTILFR